MHFGVALIAIFGAAQVAAIRFGVFEKGYEVRHADNVDRAANAIAVKGRDGQGHVTAVAASHHTDAGGVEPGLCGNPVKECIDVLVGVFAKEAVVQEGKGFAVAGGAADVRIDKRDSEFIQKIVVATEERGKGLTLRAAVNHHHHRPLAREFRRRAVQKAADHFAVECFPLGQFGRRKIRCGDSRFAVGPAFELAGRDILGVNVAGTLRIREHEGEVTAVFVPAHGANHARRQALVFVENTLGAGVKAPQSTEAVLVSHKGDSPAVMR